MRVAGCGIRDVGCAMRDAGLSSVFALSCSVLGFRYPILRTLHGYRITDFRLFSQLTTCTPQLVSCRIDVGSQTSTACRDLYCVIDRESAGSDYFTTSGTWQQAVAPNPHPASRNPASHFPQPGN